MSSISGKVEIDWGAFAARLAPVEVIAEPVLVKKRSRDFFWYSPILNAELRRCFGDLVARPATVEELAHCLSCAHAASVPVTLRGGGTGNYGQAVPLDGGLIVETRKLDRVLEIGPDFVRVQAGALISDINAALAETGRELCMFPSTQEMATIGGFVAGGSSGIGSVANGMLRDPGNLIALRALDVSAAPREHLFEGGDVLQIHHAWGLNGVITEVTLRTVPARDWHSCLATFESYGAAYLAAHGLAEAAELGSKLLSTVEARITPYFPRLEGYIRPDHHLLIAMIPPESAAPFRQQVEAAGGQVDLILSEAERAERRLPHLYDFSYNHTTLQVLKADRSATYQQVGCPRPPEAARITRLRAELGEDVWMHHEFARNGGEVVSFDLPIIWYKDRARLEEINATYAAHGFTVYDAHTWHLEGAGLKNVDYRHLAWKKRMDPQGLLNSAKSRVWESVKHLSPEEIERLGEKG